jgi:heat shock protein HslJ
MRKLSFVSILFCMVFFVACSAQKKGAAKPVTNVKGDTTIKDSIEYYDAEVEIQQKNYLHLLKGIWNVTTMQRQQRIDAESLSNVQMVFMTDSTFAGSAGCNRMSGKYTVKGTSIKFGDIITTKMACDRLEQETELLRLLQQTVSAYTVSNTELLLRDGSSNIVFKASKKD